MENYKIRVNNEARADEAKELFKKLGYHPDNSSYKPYVEWIAVFEDGSGSFYSRNVNLDECVEITIAQLRDLVVLKRNDVSDANYISKSVLDGFYFKSCDGIFYFMFEGKWVRSTTNTDEGLEPITKGSDLISGADALRALADGANPEDIEIRFSNGYTTSFISTDGKLGFIVRHLNEKLFRLKPQTIKLELELPKPFEPKVGQEVWFIDDNSKCGYSRSAEYGSDIYSYFGWWRTEEEIKQVVEQLRKIKGAV